MRVGPTRFTRGHQVSRRYLGSWALPSGNSADVYLEHGRLELRWDRPPSSASAWPAEDVTHWQSVTFPEILRAVATATGERVLGVTA